MTIEDERGASRWTSTPASVSEIVRRFHVHYEVYPESVVLRDHSIRQVGFRLELYGRVDPAGDDRCREVYHGLRDISSFIVAAKNGGCRREVAGSPATLYFSGSDEGAHACVRLDIRIVHDDGCERPIDPMEARALQEMEDHLRELRVSQGRSA